jgi:hypothetical protein
MAASYRRQGPDGRLRHARNRHNRDGHDRRPGQRYAVNDHDGRWYDGGHRDYAEHVWRTSRNHYRDRDRARGFDRYARYEGRYGYRGF